MASIAEGKYPIGTKVILSKPTTKMKQYFNIGDIFEKVNSQDFKYHFNVGKGNTEVFLKNNDIVVKISGSNSIGALFKHYTKTSTSDTNLLTETKEIVSLLTFKNNYNIHDEHRLKKKLDKKHLSVYCSEYFESSVKQNDILRFQGFRLDSKYNSSVNRGLNIFYHCERQKGNYTDILYKKACTLSGLLPDNWNPADVWFISDSIIGSFKKDIDSFVDISEVNDYVLKGIQDKTIIPISLKHVGKNNQANFKQITRETFCSDLDLNIKEIGLNFKTFRNALIKTGSGFNIRVGFKNTSSLSTTFEGSIDGSGSNIGAIDKKNLCTNIKKLTGYDLKQVKFEEKFIISLINIIYNNINIKNGNKLTTSKDMILSYKALTEKDKQQASIVIYSCWLVCIEALKTDKEFLKFLYLSSYKISEKSCSYLLLN